MKIDVLSPRFRKRVSLFLASRAGSVTLFVILVAAMTISFHSRVRALFPLVHDVEPSGDDWWTYHRYAVSVLRDGLSMPVVEGPYMRPGGFGYVYFVAACYAMFGIRSRAVYVVQTFLLAAAVLGFVHAFRRRLSSFYLLAYGLLLVVFVSLDTFRFYTFRLLSENLLIVLLAALFIAFDRLLSTGSRAAAAAAGLLCGACFLTRPNTVLIAPAWALLLVVRKRDRRSIAHAAILVTGLAVMAALIAWRDHVATGGFDLRVLTTTQDWLRPASFSLYGRRILYVFGYLHGLVPEFGSWRHWYAAWAGVLLLLVQSVRRREIDDLDLAALVFLAAYYSPLIAVADIANYGIRMLTPAMPVVLYLAVRGVMLSFAPRESRPEADGAHGRGGGRHAKLRGNPTVARRRRFVLPREGRRLRGSHRDSRRPVLTRSSTV